MKFDASHMLLRAAMADAYTTSWRNERTFEDIHFERYRLPFSPYSWVIELMLANGKVLLGEKSFSPGTFADAYIKTYAESGKKWMYPDPLRQSLYAMRSGEEWVTRRRFFSTNNEAAKRAAIVGVLPKVHDVLETATAQAIVTNDSPQGLFAARAIALTAHFALYEEDVNFGSLRPYLKANMPSDDLRFDTAYLNRWIGLPVQQAGHMYSGAWATVSAVVTLLVEQREFLDILRTTIRWGGDTTIAGIACAIMAVRASNENIPTFFKRDLKGTEELISVGKQLMEKYK